MRIWDPRKNEKYTLKDFKTKRCFSNIDEELIVVEDINVDWNDIKHKILVRSIIDNLKIKEFMVIIVPWLNEKDFRKTLDPILDVDYSLSNYFAYFEASSTSLESVINAREQLGNSDSGEWIFIGLNDNSKLEKEIILGGYTELLDHAKQFKFLMYMAEMQQYFFLIRPFAEFDLVVKNI